MGSHVAIADERARRFKLVCYALSYVHPPQGCCLL